MSETVTRQQVIEGYRLLLGRDPESEAVIAQYIEAKLALWPFLRILADSLEGRRYRLDQGAQLFTEPRPPRPIETDVPPAVGAQLISATEATWSDLGTSEPYWSVLTTDDFRVAAIDDAGRERFYASGADELAVFRAMCERNGVTLDPASTVLELGCGVGRVGEHLARAHAGYIGVDISGPHLDLARRRFAAQRIANAELLPLGAFLARPPSFGIFFSILTLQHSPPPVMLTVLDAALAGLAKGGCAFFQVPCLLYDYQFSVTDWLSPQRSRAMEMHALPQARIFRLLADNGMVPIEVVPFPRIGPIGFSFAFLAAKL